MSAIYYALILLPIIIIGLMSFVFQSNLEELSVQQLRLNCPYPLINTNVTNLNTDGVFVTYNTTFDDTPTKVTVFFCGENGVGSANSAVYTFSSGWFDAGQGWLAYMSDSMSAFFQKIDAGSRMLYLLVQAPAVVTGLAWFTYLNIILIAFIILGAFMIVRG